MNSPNYLRDALVRLPAAERRGLLESTRQRVNADPANAEAITTLWYAIYCQAVDVETDEAGLFDRL